MNLSDIPLLSGLAGRLDFLSARTNVLAKNIANADTPNFVAKDINPSTFKDRLASTTPMRVSDTRHISAPSAGSTTNYASVDAPDGEASLTGNQVSLETQAMKLSQTRQDYALVTTVYRKSLEMLRLAARGQ